MFIIFQVFQLETAMGSAIECFDSAGAVVVPRSRFAPVKTCNDLFVLRSDAYAVSPEFTVELAAEKVCTSAEYREYQLLIINYYIYCLVILLPILSHSSSFHWYQPYHSFKVVCSAVTCASCNFNILQQASATVFNRYSLVSMQHC